MKLPNAELAIVEPEKLLSYCLNLQHPRGRHKARVFAACGLDERHSDLLRQALLLAAKACDAQPSAPSPHGARFILDFEIVHARS